MIYTQWEKPRADRRKARNPPTHTTASVQQALVLGLDRDTTEGLLDRRAYLCRGQATRDEQATSRAILLRGHRQSDPRRRTEQRPWQPARQRPHERLKRRPRHPLARAKLPPASCRRQTMPAPHAAHQQHEHPGSEQSDRQPRMPEQVRVMNKMMVRRVLERTMVVVMMMIFCLHTP
jgi:hypothetical protein